MPELRRSPLAGLERPADRDAGVTLEDRPFLGKISLRGDPNDTAFAAAAAAVLGAELPGAVGQAASGDGPVILCLGPDEWLVVTAPGQAAPVTAALGDALADLDAAVIDVSSGWAALRLAGPRARDLLVKGCPIDLESPAFGPGRCAETRIGAIHAIIHQVAADPVYDLYVGRSLGRAAWEWLVDAGSEFGVRQRRP